VNDSAKVVCGNVKTANATVYIIDSVLMPTS
ncbi:fasciclin domain-containing protein, partial [Streptomyces sp. NPDC101249]